MRRLITAALASACLVSSVVPLWAEDIPDITYYKIIGSHRYAVSGGKVYCWTGAPRGHLCTPDELKQYEADKRLDADNKAKIQSCVQACKDSEDKCIMAAKAAKKDDSACKFHHCVTRC